MVTRPAKFGDVPAMVGVLRWGYDRSIYAGKVDFDEKEARAAMVNSIQRHGSRSAIGTWVQVSEGADGGVNGLIVGALQRVYQVGVQCTASDVFWITNDKASARDSVALMLSLVDWAKAHPKVVEILCGATGAMGDWSKASRILEKMGLGPFGSLFRMEVTR